MAHRITKDLPLVGSIPLSSTEEVFRTCGTLLGDEFGSESDESTSG